MTTGTGLFILGLILFEKIRFTSSKQEYKKEFEQVLQAPIQNPIYSPSLNWPICPATF